MPNKIKQFLANFRLLDEIKTRGKKFLWVLGKDAFLFILFILLIEVIFAEFLFYKYVLSVEIEEPSLSEGSIGFQKEEFQSVLFEWQRREEFFNNYPAEDVSDPFQQ